MAADNDDDNNEMNRANEIPNKKYENEGKRGRQR